MRPSRRCAICQKSTTESVCAECKQLWDQDSEWVKTFVKMELHWRRLNYRERKYAPLHISVDGQLHHKRKRISAYYLLKQQIQCSRIESYWLFEDIKLWAMMTGLSSSERFVYYLMMSGLTGYVSTAAINEMAHRQITRPAYRRRRRKLFHKIRSALESSDGNPKSPK